MYVPRTFVPLCLQAVSGNGMTAVVSAWGCWGARCPAHRKFRVNVATTPRVAEGPGRGDGVSSRVRAAATCPVWEHGGARQLGAGGRGKGCNLQCYGWRQPPQLIRQSGEASAGRAPRTACCPQATSHVAVSSWPWGGSIVPIVQARRLGPGEGLKGKSASPGVRPGLESAVRAWAWPSGLLGASVSPFTA